MLQFWEVFLVDENTSFIGGRMFLLLMATVFMFGAMCLFFLMHS